MGSRRSILVLLALACLVPAASAECLTETSETVVHGYPRCDNVTQHSLYDCFCPWREPANQLTCPLPDNIP